MLIPPAELDRMFSFDNQLFSLHGMFGPRLARRVGRILAEERRFLKSEIAPLTLEEDLAHAQDHNHLSWELMRRAGRQGSLTDFVPKFLGGSGGPTHYLAFFSLMEERGAVDCAYTGMLGGHILGLFCALANLRVLLRAFDQTVAHCRDEKPYVVSLAITEPSAGTDVEEYDLYPAAKLVCHAHRTSDGAVLNGRKVFISTGHMATDHVVIAPFDLKDPRENMGMFLVNRNDPGFSLGRKERKMGQRSGPASELIFEDCHIPRDRILSDPEEFPSLRGTGTFRHMLEFSLGLSRIAVGAWSTGTARGALERAVELAAATERNGRALIQEQWCQAILSDMLLNVTAARAVYLEAQFSAMLALFGRGRMFSVPDFIGRPPFTALNRFGFEKLGVRKLVGSRWARWLLHRRMRGSSPEAMANLQVMSSLAKVAGSDAAMKNCHLAVEMLGRAGLRHDRGLEKIFRDAKLLQIFEGTNQLNRLNAFNHFFGRRLGVEVF